MFGIEKLLLTLDAEKSDPLVETQGEFEDLIGSLWVFAKPPYRKTQSNFATLVNKSIKDFITTPFKKEYEISYSFLIFIKKNVIIYI